MEAFGWSLSFSPDVKQNEETGFRRVLGEEKLPEIRDYSAITSSKLYCLSTGTQYYCYYGKTTQQPRRTPVHRCLCFSADPSKKSRIQQISWEGWGERDQKMSASLYDDLL